MSSSRRRNLVLALCLAAGMLGPRFAHAAIVERVVAIVGERPILLSDLRHRAQPFLHRILAAQLSPAQQAAQETAMFKELVNQLIDDRLVEHAADQAHVSVTPDEIDSALQNVAARSKRSVPQLLLEAVRRGLTEQDYRDEIRRQILLGRLVQLRVRGRVRVTDEDTRATYDHWAREFETQHPVDVRIIAMRLPRGATEATLSGRLKVAEQVVKRARNGEDYCSLVRQFSDEPGAGDTCGSPGLQPLNVLHGPIQDAVRRMRQGETSDPILFGNDTIVVVQVASQPKVLPFEQLKQEMTEAGPARWKAGGARWKAGPARWKAGGARWKAGPARWTTWRSRRPWSIRRSCGCRSCGGACTSTSGCRRGSRQAPDDGATVDPEATPDWFR